MQATVPEFFKHASSEATSGKTTGPTFATVDCYTGGNLGDGAIQDASDLEHPTAVAGRHRHLRNHAASR